MLVIAELCVEPADRVEGAGLAEAFAVLAAERQCLLRVLERFPVAALPVEQHRQAAVGMGQAELVAELAVELDGQFEAGLGFWIGAEHAECAGGLCPRSRGRRRSVSS